MKRINAEGWKIGVFGGSFNPVHNGHIGMAEQFFKQLQLNKLLFVPSKNPPHKKRPNDISDDARIKLLNAAVQDRKKFSICLFEMESEAVTYTYDTLRHLKEIYRGATLFFLLGADMFLSVDSWAHFPELLGEAIFCTMPRNGGELPKLLRKFEEIEKLGYRTIVLDTPPIEVSSTEVRRRIFANEHIGNMVPSEVERLIREEKLYL